MKSLYRFTLSALSIFGIVWLIEQTGLESSSATVQIVIVVALIVAYATKPNEALK